MNTQLLYDVVIMGAGFAGNCQARHLLLNIPNIRIALIDPSPEQRTDEDLMGESAVEVASLFLCKELGLYEYMLENHPPKLGLNFHWPKDPTQTQTTDDYYHIWCNRQPHIDSVQLNHAKFERDLLKMNKDMGVEFYNGYVADVELTTGDALKTVKVKVGDDYLELKAKHVVDAAGRKFIIGHKTDNLLFEKENLFGVNSGSAWVRVKHVDRTIFHSGYDPNGATCSHYYATNHWFGHGHWLWMIPTDRETQEVSIGIIQYDDVISTEHINTREKFYAFLQANHNMLYRLISSGENVDFHYLPRLAYTSKTMFSPDNWYVIGDAACIFDAFYSLGTTMIAFGVESATEIIRAKLSGEVDAEVKRSAYNDFNLACTQRLNSIIEYHAKQLGHASVMSWRVYLEYMWFFGLVVPMYIGKWHLDLNFILRYLKSPHAKSNEFFKNVYEQFNQLVDRNINIGLIDPYRADQLLGDYSATNFFDNFLQNTKLEPRRCNVFASLKYTTFYTAIWYAQLQWKGFGLSGLLAPRNLNYFFSLLKAVVQTAIDEQVYNYKTKGLPTNTQVANMRQEFTSYRYQAQLQPWGDDLAAHNQESVLPHSSGKETPSTQESKGSMLLS